MAGVQEGGSPTGSIWLHPTFHELASTITLCQCPPQSPTQLFTRVFQSRGQLILFPSHLNFQSLISVLWGSSSLSLTSIPPAAPTAFFCFSFLGSSSIQMPQPFQLLLQLSAPHLSLILPSLTPAFIHFDLLVSGLGRRVTNCPVLPETVPVLVLKKSCVWGNLSVPGTVGHPTWKVGYRMRPSSRSQMGAGFEYKYKKASSIFPRVHRGKDRQTDTHTHTQRYP